MIIVTGATGQLGQAIVKRLLDTTSATQVGVSVRDPVKAANLAACGVRVRQGDFADADSLRSAFEDAEQVLMVSSNAGAYGGDPIAQHRTAINAAKDAGARRIVYTSHMGSSATSAFPPMHTHHATEQMLRDSGIAWTALRNGFYAESALPLLGDLTETDALELPESGKVSWTTHADLADAAASILIAEGRFDGPTHPLTAMEALDFDELVDIVANLQGRSIRVERIGDEAMRASLASRGVPGTGIKMQLGLLQASRDGEFSKVDPTLAHLLGREPQRMHDVLASNYT